MKAFFKLLAFEFERFSKFFTVLIGITVTSQLIGIIYESRDYVSSANELIYEDRLPVEQFLKQTGPMTMAKVTDTLWVLGPIALCIVALIFYSFFIWYREWFGRTTFAYRLLMLPVPRMQIFFSKLTVIYLSVLGLVALQIGLLWVGNGLVRSLVPSGFFLDMSVMDMLQRHSILRTLIPVSFIRFLTSYGVGLMALIVLFTCILLERSYRGAGVLAALLYGGAAALLIFSPIGIQAAAGRSLLYDSETFLLSVALGVLIAAVSIFFSSKLLNRQVTV